MSLRPSFILPTTLLLLSIGSAQAQSHDKSAFQAAQRRNAEFRRDQFVDAGLPSIEAVAKSGRTVRRMWLQGFYPVGFPIMELERMRDGSVFFSLFRSGSVIHRVQLDGKIWRDIVAQDREVFEAPTPTMPPPRPPTAVCHGDIAYFEAADSGRTRSAGAVACAGTFNAAQRSAVDAFAGLARETLGCARIDGSDAVSNLVNCVGLKQRQAK